LCHRSLDRLCDLFDAGNLTYPRSGIASAIDSLSIFYRHSCGDKDGQVA
jgi:hypothetical protein